MTESWLADWMKQGPNRKKSKGLMRRLLRAEQLEQRYVLTGSGCGVGGDPGTSTVTIEKLNVVREGDSDVAAFRVHRTSSGPASLPVNLSYTGSATNGVNFSAPTTVTFPSGNSYVDVSLNGIVSASPLGSIVVEVVSTSDLTCASQPTYQPGESSVAESVLIEHKPSVSIGVSDASISEEAEETTTFTITRTGPTDEPLIVQYRVSGLATYEAGSPDYSSTVAFDANTRISDSIEIEASESSVSIDITAINDAIRDNGENVTIEILASVEDYEIQGPGSATAIIVDADTTPPSLPVVTIAGPGAAVAEGSNATFTISISGVTTPVTVYWGTVDATAVASRPGQQDGDYTRSSGFVTLNSSNTSDTFTVPTLPDGLFGEPEEQFNAVITSIVGNAVPGNYLATATIYDVTPLREIRIDDIRVIEPEVGGDPAQAIFTVTASGSGTAVTVNWTTVDDTATTANSDYNSGSGTVSFPASASGSTQTIIVQVLGDSVYLEGDEFYNVVLSGESTGAAIVDNTGLGTIVDRDNPDGDLDLILEHTTYVCACNCCGQVPIDAKDGDPIVAIGTMQPIYRGDGPLSSQGVVNVAAQFDTSRTLESVDVRLKIDGSWLSPVSYQGITAGDSGWLVFTQEIDLSSKSKSAGYPMEIEVKAYYDDGDTTRNKTGFTYILDKESESAFGPRWYLPELGRLALTTSGAHQGAALIYGNGLARWYAKSGGSFITPDGTFANLAAVGGGYHLTQPTGEVDVFNSAGLLIMRLDRNWNPTRYEYTDADGDSKADEISKIVDIFGRGTEYKYASGKLDTVTQFGRETTYSYTGSLITGVEHPDPDDGGPLTAPTQSFAYDGDGRLIEYEDPLVRSTTYSYDDFGRVDQITVTDATDRKFSVLATLGLKQGKTGSLQNPLKIEDLWATLEDGRTHTAKVRTDDYGNQIEYSSTEEHTITERNADGLPVRVTQKGKNGDPDRITTNEYNTDGQVTRSSNPDHSDRHWEYDPASKQPSKFTDELDRVTQYKTDAQGNQLSETKLLTDRSLPPIAPSTPNQLQRNPYNIYDVDGDRRLTAIDQIIFSNWLNTETPGPVSGSGDGKFRDINGDGYLDALDYIAFINYQNAYDPKVTTTYTYTSASDKGALADLPNGLLLTATDPLGRITTYAYETSKADPDFGRLLSVTEADGLADEATTGYEYDTAGNVTAIIDPLGVRTEFEYDKLDRKVKLIEPHPTNPSLDGPVTEYEYDAVGNLTSVTDPLTYVTSYKYDSKDRLIEITQPIPVGANPDDAPVTLYEYDENGNLTKITDPLERVTQFEYDESDRLVLTIYPNETQEKLKYSGFGEVIERSVIGVFNPLTEDKADFTATNSYEYDASGRLLSTTLPEADGVTGSELSDKSVYNAAGELLSYTDRLGRTTNYSYDSFGRLNLVTLPEPNSGAGRPELWTAYDNVGNVVAEIDALGNFTEWRYDALNRVKQVREMDPDGTSSQTSAVTTFTYDDAGQVLIVNNPAGRDTEYIYDRRGQNTQVTEAYGTALAATTYFLYDDAGNMWQTKDPLGRVVTFGYDRLHRLADQVGDTDEMAYTYYKDGQLETQTDGLSRETKYEYDSLGRIAKIIYPDPGGSATQPEMTYAYQDLGKSSIVTIEDKDGDKLIRTSNAWGLLIEEDHEGSVTSYEYDLVGNVKVVTDPMTRATKYDYDDLDRLIKTTAPDPDDFGGVDASETEYEYDLAGNLLTVIDPLTHETSYTYDDRYRRLTSKDALNGETEFTYDKNGNLTSLTDPVGNETTWEYDILDRVTKETNELNKSRYFEYDDVGNVVWKKDRLNRETWLEYDDMNRVTREEWWGTQSWSPDYPGAMIVTTQVPTATNEVQSVSFYDMMNNLSGSFSVTFSGQTAYFMWDATAGQFQTGLENLSNIAPGDVSVYKPGGGAMSQGWEITFGGNYAGQNVPQMTLDITFINPSSSTKYGYTWTYPEGSTSNEKQTITPYSATGGTYTLSFGGFTTAAIDWDATAGELESALEALTSIDNVSVSGSAGGPYTVEFLGTHAGQNVALLTANTGDLTNASLQNVVTYEYDAAGQLEFAGDEAGTYEYDYDGLGRLQEETQNIVGLPEVVFESGYNVKSGRTSLAASINGTDDFLRTYTRDEWNRVTQLLEEGQSGGNGVVRKEIDFTYNAAHQYESIVRYEGTSPTLIATTSFGYDGMGRLDDLHHQNGTPATLARYQYDFDLASRIEQITSYVDGVSDFSYDDTNQLTDADHAGSGPPDEDYEYDANGNRDSSGFDVDPNNQIATDGTYNYTYDNEGNRATKTLISTGDKEEYTWDHRNRLVTITFKNSSNVITKKVDQTYDVWNQWVKRKVDPDGAGGGGSSDTYFAYESGQITLQWEDTDGFVGYLDPAMSHRYTWAEGVDQFLADEQISTPGTAGNTLWGLGDHLGTLRDIADLSGGTVSITNHRDYNSFGSLTSETNAAVDLIFGYTSRPWDEASGLQNNLNRWYDPVLKQWMSEDPIEFGGGDANLRRYVGGHPVLSVDPNGLVDGWQWDWHHLLDKDIFDSAFMKRHNLSIDIHSPRYGYMLRARDHTYKGGVHPEGWSKEWTDWIKDHENAKVRITQEMIDEKLAKMMEKFKLCEKGFPAKNTYQEQQRHNAEQSAKKRAAKAAKEAAADAGDAVGDAAKLGSKGAKSTASKAARRAGGPILGAFLGFGMAFGVSSAQGDDEPWRAACDSLDIFDASELSLSAEIRDSQRREAEAEAYEKWLAERAAVHEILRGGIDSLARQRPQPGGKYTYPSSRPSRDSILPH
jgi:RHS repeat-associated protein